MPATVDNPIAHKLFDAAVELFARKGYGATSTREIVEAAGVTKPMLYYYFQSKEGLLAAALAHFCQEFHDRLRQVVAAAGITPEEQLAELVWAHLDYCQSHKPLARLFYALHFGPDDHQVHLNLETYACEGRELVAQVVLRAVEANVVDPARVEDFQFALHGMIHIWVMTSLKEDRELNSALASRIVADLLQGFRSHL